MPQQIAKLEAVDEGVVFIPTKDNIIVRPAETPEYKGRIIIPGIAKDNFPITGYVIDVGGNLLDDEGNWVTEYKKGDKVVFSKYAGYAITLDNNTRLFILKDSDILLILSDDLKIKDDPS